MPPTNGTGADVRPRAPWRPRMIARAEPTITDSVVRVFEAGQRVVLDRVDLARFDLAQLAASALRSAALVAIGAVCLAGAWFALLAGAVAWSLAYLPLPAALILAAALSAIAGGALIAAGVQRARAGEGLGIPGMLRPLRDGVRE